MAGLAAVTTRIKLLASVAVLTVPPALLARMAVTNDSISHGRFGVNIVSGWQKAEYEQMGIWPGERHFEKHYDYCSEYVQVTQELWATGRSDFNGEFFQMNDCRVSPRPSAKIDIISAGGINDVSQVSQHTERLIAANKAAGANCKAMLLMMIITDETDEVAMAK